MAKPPFGIASASERPSTTSMVRNRTPSTLLDRIERDDVGVVQGGSGAGFLLEPAKSLGIVGKCRRQHLDGDVAAEARITGAVHLAHPAGAEQGRRFHRGQGGCRARETLRVLTSVRSL